MTRFWDGRTDGQTDGQTDGVTALLDLLSPSATQVKSTCMCGSLLYSVNNQVTGFISLLTLRQGHRDDHTIAGSNPQSIAGNQHGSDSHK